MNWKDKRLWIGAVIVVIVVILAFTYSQSESDFKTNQVKSVPKSEGILCPKVHEEIDECKKIDGNCYCHYWAAWGCEKDSDCVVPKEGIARCTNIDKLGEEGLEKEFYDVECYCFKNSFCYEENIECADCKLKFISWCENCLSLGWPPGERGKETPVLPVDMHSCMKKCFNAKFPKTTYCDAVQNICRNFGVKSEPKEEVTTCNKSCTQRGYTQGSCYWATTEQSFEDFCEERGAILISGNFSDCHEQLINITGGEAGGGGSVVCCCE